MSRQLKPSRGDLVQIDWADIYEDPTGDPDRAVLKRRISYALFWDRKVDNATGLEVVVTTTTFDDDAPAQQGYCIYPAACVVALKVIKRVRHHTQRPK